MGGGASLEEPQLGTFDKLVNGGRIIDWDAELRLQRREFLLTSIA